MKADCRDIEALLSPYADGELDADGARRVESHLAECAACRETLAAWRETEDAFASVRVERSDVEWERLARRVDDAIDAAEAADARAGGRVAAAASAAAPRAARGPAPERRRVHPWLWGSSGVLVAAALVMLFWPWITSEDGGMQTRTRSPQSIPPATRPPAVAGNEGADARAGTPAETGLTGADIPVAQGDGKAPGTRGVDIRRVAIEQEAKRKDELSASLSKETLKEVRDDSAVAGEAQGFAPQTPPPALQAAPSPPAPDGSAEAAPEPAEATKSMTRDVTRSWSVPRAETSSRERQLGEVQLQDADGTAPDSAFAATQRAAQQALDSGEPAALERAVSSLAAFALAYPDDARRVEALAQRVRVLAALAVHDPDRWCAGLSVARMQWRDAAGEAVAFPAPEPAEAACP